MPEGRQAPNEAVKVLLVDDHALYRGGLRALLADHGIEVVGEADSGEAALDLVAKRLPEVVVMDLRMPGLSGIDTTRLLRTRAPLTPVLVLSASAADDDLVDAVMAGACGYVVKNAPTEELVAGIRAAARGESLISPPVAAKLLLRLQARGGDLRRPDAAHADLTARELDVLRLLSDGKDNAEIARELHVSASTVKHHVSTILAKLQMENRIQAAVYAVRSGLV